MRESDDIGILVVDDDEDILFTVKSIFKKYNIPIKTAISGMECIRELEGGFKGVVLMDIMMPVMDGWDTIKEIVNRGLNENLIISMFTAKDAPDPKMEYLKEYVFDYITKPFEPEDLINAVQEYLELLD